MSFRRYLSMVLVEKQTIQMSLLVVHAFVGLPHIIRPIAIDAMRKLLFRRSFNGPPLAFRIKVEIVHSGIDDLTRYLGADLYFFFGGHVCASTTRVHFETDV